jgi:large conductance mechanosensitive channel
MDTSKQLYENKPQQLTSRQIKEVYNSSSPQLTNMLKFILYQEPIKVAMGAALGIAVMDLFNGFANNLAKPTIHTVINKISSSGLSYTFLGSEINFGTILEKIIIFILFLILFYYAFVIPINKLRVKYNIDLRTKVCPYCATFINPYATKCPSCTSDLN